MIRKIIFWLHLITGVSVAAVVVLMSFTGVILTYERQMAAWVDSQKMEDRKPGAQRASLSEILEFSEAVGVKPVSLTMPSSADLPVNVSAGRGRGSIYIDPYNGKVVSRSDEGIRKIFSDVRGWHSAILTLEFKHKAKVISGHLDDCL